MQAFHRSSSWYFSSRLIWCLVSHSYLTILKIAREEKLRASYLQIYGQWEKSFLWGDLKKRKVNYIGFKLQSHKLLKKRKSCIPLKPILETGKLAVHACSHYYSFPMFWPINSCNWPGVPLISGLDKRYTNHLNFCGKGSVQKCIWEKAGPKYYITKDRNK